MSNEVLKYLSQEIQKEIAVMTEDTALGKAKEFGDYKYACGIIRGLMMANAKLADVAERMEQEDD
jgi:uncharacterized protein (DUF2164 family)